MSIRIYWEQLQAFEEQRWAAAEREAQRKLRAAEREHKAKHYLGMSNTARKTHPHEHNDCTVYALALTAGCTYQEAHDTLKWHGRRDGGRFPFRTHAPAMFQEYGKQLKEVDLKAIEEDKGSGVTTITVGRYLSKRKRYVVYVRGHVLAVIGGVVQDWSASRRMRVRAIYEVTGS